MRLLLVGLSHRTAPVEIRERVDFQARGIGNALRAVVERGSAHEAVIVSTCNRAELYVGCEDTAATRSDLVGFIAEYHGVALLVVGAGEMGKLTALHMKSHGVQQVTIVSRSMAHAARTAEAIGGASAAPWEEIDAALGASDIVITATGATAPILTKARIE